MKIKRNENKSINSLFYLIGAVFLSACSGNVALIKTPNVTATASPTPTASTSTAIKAAKIIFKLTSNSGSFKASAYSPAGTPPTPGSGLPVDTLFNPDGTVLTTGGSTSANWPGWLSSFEIGVSGNSNTTALNPYCANFASAYESSVTNCNLSPSPLPSPANCGAPASLFRVSEVDCTSASAGNGSSTDPIYLRAQFNRNTAYLGANENILVVLEYSVAGLNPAPSNPTNCFSSSDGKFTPENCSDFVWRVFLKSLPTDSPLQSFMILVPPTYSSVLSTSQSAPPNSGAGIVTKQFVLPLATNSTFSTLQISRTGVNFPSSSDLLNYCTSGGSLPGNSPLCAGMVFYSITFYRI